MLDHVPLGRPATTDEIAIAALFLADPENSYITGHILTVDGGWTAGDTRDFCHTARLGQQVEGCAGG